jgi:hypothetical protein
MVRQWKDLKKVRGTVLIVKVLHSAKSKYHQRNKLHRIIVRVKIIAKEI